MLSPPPPKELVSLSIAAQPMRSGVPGLHELHLLSSKSATNTSAAACGQRERTMTFFVSVAAVFEEPTV